MLGHTTQLASDTIVGDAELFQIDQFSELLGQFSCKNMKTFFTCKNTKRARHTTHVCWSIRLALKLVVARMKVRQIDKVAKLLGQFSCKM